MTTPTKPTLDLAELRRFWHRAAVELLASDSIAAAAIVDIAQSAYDEGREDSRDALRTAELERDEAVSKLEAVRELVRPEHVTDLGYAGIEKLRRLLGEKGGE